MAGGSRMSYILVGVQLVCLGLIVVTGPLIPPGWLGQLLVLCGFLVAVWGVLAMRIPDVSILPEVRPGARLVSRGPYRYIRHPMYSGLLLGGLGLVLGAPIWWRGLIWLVLLADLLIKLRYEEQLLARRFPDYAAYSRRTWRLIPFVY